ncbi:MAG: PAS domain S-box protein [Deltaproteobacteria bacterium]|nr:PAS domain S-box protein [Deltaproteobacteria bacterium]
MRKKPGFIKLIKIWGIIILLTLSGSIVALDIIGSYRDFNTQAAQLRTNYIARQKQMVKREVARVVDIIRYEKAQSEQLTRTKIKARVYEAYAIAQNIYRQNKNRKSKAEVQKLILEALGPIWFEQGHGYYFVTRLDGVGVLFADKPELEGADLSGVSDINGKHVVKDMIAIVRQSGEGFYEYHWTKPESAGKDNKKISYIKRFEPYDWFIGTGLYVDDIEKQIETRLLSTISRIRFGKEGYIFIDGFNGDALIANGKFFSKPKKLWEVFNKNPEKSKDLFRKELRAATKPNGDFIRYSIVKLTDPNKESPKISFIYGIPELQWLVGAGIYLDDVETEIAAMHADLNNRIQTKIFYFTLIVAGILVLFLILFNALTRRLKHDFNLFISFFNRASRSDEQIDRDLIQFKELDRMAEDANKMLAGRRQAEEALQQNEAKFRRLIESSSDWIWEVNKDGVFTYASPQIETILGYKPEEVIGRTPFELMPEDEAEQTTKIFTELIETGRPIVMLENVCLHKDGRLILLETSGVPVFDAAGEVSGYSGIDRDITERKKVEESLQKMEKLESIGTLAGGIAHDFNNILMGLFGNISMAKRDLPDDHPVLKRLAEAENSMNRATRLTKQLLTFAKGGAPVRENVCIAQLAEEVVRFDLSGSNVKLVFNQADDLWSAEVDKGQIQQVFSNLSINANQAMPDGGHLYLTLENLDNSAGSVPSLKKGKYIKVSVRDEGTGIAEKHFERIFDPYFSTKQSGSGLGLATVHSIIHKHGGDISVASESGKGTVFTFYLPAAEAPQQSPVEQPASHTPAEGQKGRILVMDDEVMVCDLAVQMLETSGFAVATAADGQRAIDMYKQSMEDGETFAAVIMDLTIPGGIGGKEAIKEIIAIDPEARVIVSSGYADDPVMANYSAYGFQGIIAKPYTLDNLQDVLGRILAEKQLSN